LRLKNIEKRNLWQVGASQGDRGDEFYLEAGYAKLRQSAMVISCRLESDAYRTLVTSQNIHEPVELIKVIEHADTTASLFAGRLDQHLVTLFRNINRHQNRGLPNLQAVR
jgi:hypothetical protein